MEAHRRRRILLTALISHLPLAAQGAADHPLDALDASEITATTALLRSAGHADDKTLIASITLQEPLKAGVLAWKTGNPFPRRAKAVLRRNSTTFEAVVDLGSAKVSSHKAIRGAQPLVTYPEILSAIAVTTGDPRMQEGLRKRGITDFGQLFCAPRTAGNFGTEAEKTKRIVKVDCFDIRGVRTDVFANPIEGLFATVDLDRGEALTGQISVPAWKCKPNWYLVATDDRMIPPPAQRSMASRAGSKVVETRGSHAVYVSQPEAVADLIRKAA